MKLRLIFISVSVLTMIFALFPSGVSAVASPLKSHLLTVTDLPPGWSVTRPHKVAASSSPCLNAIHQSTQSHSHRASVAFSKGAAPIVGEALSTGGSQHKAWLHLRHALANCGTFTVSLGDRSVSGNTTALSFPSIGASSSAYTVKLTLTGVGAGYDVVLFQAGPYYGLLAYGVVGTPKVTDAWAFVREAVEKAEGVPVTPPATTT